MVILLCRCPVVPEGFLLLLASQICQLDNGEELGMNRTVAIFIASFGVFVGSLLSDVLLGDGIQYEDVNQAAMVALIAAGIQWWLNRRKK